MSDDRRPQLGIGTAAGHAGFAPDERRSAIGQANRHRPIGGWGCLMVTAAAGVMMRNTLVGARGQLLLLPVEVSFSPGRHRNAVESLGSMRGASRPQHQDEHDRAKESSPPVHLWRH